MRAPNLFSRRGSALIMVLWCLLLLGMAVFGVVESFLAAGFAAAGVELKTPFPRVTYDESMRRFGSNWLSL